MAGIPPDPAPQEESLDEAERRAIRTLGPELEEHSVFTQSAFDFMQELLASVSGMSMPDMPPSLKVAISLLARLSNDLRCAHWLVHRGYAVQAGTLVASMYEVAFTIMFIGSDDDLAQAWIDHEDPTRSFRDVWLMTREGLRKLEVAEPDSQAIVEYRVYSQLCMARHANPLFQTQHSFREIEQGTVSPIVGPDEVGSLRGAQFSMQHAGGLCFLAAASFVKEHLEPRLPKDVVDGLVEKMRAVGQLMKALKEKAKARWGTEDPFPGKWRHMGRQGGAMPAVNVPDELRERIVKFQQIVEAILGEKVTFEQCVEIVLSRGLYATLDDIIGALPPEVLKESIQQLGSLHPEEVYKYVADNLRHGALEAERERVRRQIGFRRDRG